MSVKELTQPAKRHGGKSYLAKQIIGLMPPRVTNPNAPAADDPGWVHYVEPFFGGGAVLFANDPEGISEVVNDVDLNDDAIKVIRQQDGPRTLFYCDPPYLHETRTVTDAYAHEMTAAEHGTLLNTLAGIKGRFLLSGYPSGLYQQYENEYGWSRTDFEIDNKAGGGKTKRRMTECVWRNF